jgi:hypothetical protein
MEIIMKRLLVLALVAATLGGCAVYVPGPHPYYHHHYYRY